MLSTCIGISWVGGRSQFKRINSRSAFHVATLCWRFGMASQHATIPIAPCVSQPDSFPHLPHSPGSPEGAEIEIPGRSSTPSSVEQLRDAATRCTTAACCSTTRWRASHSHGPGSLRRASHTYQRPYYVPAASRVS